VKSPDPATVVAYIAFAVYGGLFLAFLVGVTVSGR
jgi:hypothetical protein